MTGLAREIIEGLDPALSLKRIKNDIQTDFIFAPHLNAIYVLVGEILWDRLSAKLKSGEYESSLPYTLEVPKSSGLSRPGSILNPFDRLAYQVVVDSLASQADYSINRSQVFSYSLLKDDYEGLMFEPASESYSKFQAKVSELCRKREYTHVLKADVSNYFERIYHHVLINSLRSAGCNPQLVNFLEDLLSKLRQKDSHGIIQGLFPSDFLGTFYLCTIDAEHQLRNIPFFRYVDDMYCFFKNLNDARIHKVELCSLLRRDGLNLNSAKTKIYRADRLIREVTAIERMFEEARDEVGSEFERADFYHSTIAWDFQYGDSLSDEIDEQEVDLKATENLFNQFDIYEEMRDKIDKFSLKIFAAAESSYALDYVLREYVKSAHMSQVFAKYLKIFIKDKAVCNAVEYLLFDKDIIFDYQRMWLYAILTAAERVSEKTVDLAINSLRNKNFSESLRAVCAIFIGKFGNAAQRRILENHYEQEGSQYVRSAILYAARHFPSGERNSCYSAWGGHSEINSLIVKAAKAVGDR